MNVDENKFIILRVFHPILTLSQLTVRELIDQLSAPRPVTSGSVF